MKVFVTGGSGFVGGHAIEGLVARGHEARALARSSAAADKVRAFGATPVSGDLGTLDAAMMSGCDAVVHAAAYVEEWGPRERYWEANVEGTTRALQAARAAGVRRFIHIGTEAALFDGSDLVDVDESVPFPARHRYPYSETKAEAERRVLAAHDEAFQTISLRPRFVWGPRDTSVLPTILKMVEAGRFAWIDRGRALTSTTHVDNLVHAIALALTAGAGGRAYFIADDGTRSLRDFIESLARTQGVALPDKNVPRLVARPVAWGVERFFRLAFADRQPPMTRFAVDMMSSTITVSTERARSELGYAPVASVEEGLARMTRS